MFLSSQDMQLGRGEPIRDTARVLGRMTHGAVIRTYAQHDVEEFAEYGGIPTINALTDEEHPCQIVADLMTMKELCGGWEGKRVCFLGDADCNVAKSWMWAARHLGFELVLSGPPDYLPGDDYLARLNAANVTCESEAETAVKGCDVLYTDVWVSMGKEEESQGRLASMQPYQVNEALLKLAAPGAIVLHCLPAYRGKEITEGVLESHAPAIFQEAENRLHAQKAILEAVVS